MEEGGRLSRRSGTNAACREMIQQQQRLHKSKRSRSSESSASKSAGRRPSAGNKPALLARSRQAEAWADVCQRWHERRRERGVCERCAREVTRPPLGRREPEAVCRRRRRRASVRAGTPVEGAGRRRLVRRGPLELLPVLSRSLSLSLSLSLLLLGACALTERVRVVLYYCYF